MLQTQYMVNAPDVVEGSFSGEWTSVSILRSDLSCQAW